MCQILFKEKHNTNRKSYLCHPLIQIQIDRLVKEWRNSSGVMYFLHKPLKIQIQIIYTEKE